MSESYNPNFLSHNKNQQAKKIKVTVIDKTSSKRAHTFSVFAWATVGFLKNKIKDEFGVETKNQRLFYCNYELNKNNAPLFSYAAVEKWTVYLVQPSNFSVTIRPLDAFDADPAVDELIDQLRDGLLKYQPKLTSEGTSGSYFVFNRGKEQAAIFKPIDEEAYAPNNPRGFVGKYGSNSFKKGILSGEAGVREVAAYILDHNNYHRVPPTTLVELVHPYFENKNAGGYLEEETDDVVVNEEEMKMVKQLEMVSPMAKHGESNPDIARLLAKKAAGVKIGSLQKFVKHDDSASNFGYSVFDVDEVHRIAILDLRIMNADRNDENILIKFRPDPERKRKKLELIPIDHGLSIPDCFEICEYEIIWMDWPQTKEPFSARELDYIRELNPIQDAKNLRKYITLREECYRNLVLSTIVLKYCALRGGLSLYDIGKIVYREDEDCEAEINKIIERTEAYMKILQDRKIDGLKDKSRSEQKKTLKKGENAAEEEEKKGEPILVSPELRPRAMSVSQPDGVMGCISLLSPTPDKNGLIRPIVKLDSQIPEEPIVVEKEKNNKLSISTSSDHDENRSSSDEEKESRHAANRSSNKHHTTTVSTVKYDEKGKNDEENSNNNGTDKVKKSPKNNSGSTPVVLKRAISEPDIQKMLIEKTEDNVDKIKKKKDKKAKNDKYYEMFFHYFESFLEQYLLNKFGPRQSHNFVVGNRPHSNSMAVL